MKKFFHHIRKRMLAGLILLLPLFAILLIMLKLYKMLKGEAGSQVANFLGVKPLLGKNAVPVTTAFLLALILYVFGGLVKLRWLNKMRDWIENTLLQFVPGYLTYKAQVLQKINPKEDSRIPVWVTTVVGKRPGLLINEQNEEAVIFFPNSPDSNNG